MSNVPFVRDKAGYLQRILVVDDDPVIVRLVKDKLEGAGYEVFTANSGRQALDVLAQRGMPHLAVVDVNMPLMNGFEFCQAVIGWIRLPGWTTTSVSISPISRRMSMTTSSLSLPQRPSSFTS